MVSVEGVDHTVSYMNVAFCRLMGQQAGQLIGKSFHELLPEKDHCLTLLDRVWETGNPETWAEEASSPPNPVFWSYTMWPIWDEDGRVGVMIQVTETAQLHDKTIAMNEALMLGSVRQHELTEVAEGLNALLRLEILERKEVEAALRASEDRYRSLFDSIDEGFCIVQMIFDPAGRPIDFRILENNSSFEKQTGLHGVTGKNVLEFVPNLEKYWFETYGKVALTGEPIRFVNYANGLEESWFDVYAFRVGEPELAKVAILLNNITERKLAEVTLRNSEESLRGSREEIRRHAGSLEKVVSERTAELTTTNKQLEAFVYSIAHDLRAPLRAMQAYATMLMGEEGADLGETGRNYAARINKSAQFMDALLMDLLAFSRISQQSIQLCPVKLKSVVESVLGRLELDIKDKHALVKRVDAWPVVLAHEPTLTQVLFNLLSNALKFVRAGVVPEVHLWPEQRGGFIRVWVEDNGVGISPEHREQIFRLFTRLNSEAFSGTGIGLAIVEKGVERMGGKTGVESTPEQGSRFWFELPISP
jgi:signal transduction histidine kinase